MDAFFPELKNEEEIATNEKSKTEITTEIKTEITEDNAGDEIIEVQETTVEVKPEKRETSEERNLRRWNKYTDRIIEAFEKSESSNIQDTAIELFRSYLNWTWGVFVRECFSRCCGTFENAQVAASVLSIINSKLVDVGKKTIMYTLYRFKAGFENQSNRDIENAAIFIGECYRQRMVSSSLMIQIFDMLFQEKRKFIQTIIKLFWSVIPVINDDDENAMKILFDSLYKYQNDDQFARQIERIYNWRQNDWTNNVKGTSKKYARVPRRFDMIEEDDQITHDTIDLDEIQTEVDPIARYVVPYALESADKMHDDYKEFLEATLADDEEEEEDNNEASTIPIDLSDAKLTAESIQSAQQKNNELQIKRRIYLTLVSNATANATAHNIVKIEDKYEGRYDNVIVTTVIEYVGMEKTFNRDLAVIVQMLCRVKKVNRQITEELFQVNYDQTYSYTIHRITNIACLYSYLLANEEISWSILQAIRLTEEDTNSAQRVFIRILVEELAKNMSYDGFIRKLKQPDVEEWTSGIFPTDTIDHAEFASAYFTEIKLERICENLNKKIEEMAEEIRRQHEEELKLLQPTPQMAWKETNQQPENNDNNTTTYELKIDEDKKEDKEKESSHRHRHRHKHIHRHSKNADDDNENDGYQRHKYYDDIDEDDV
ncbi:hypothetical protein M9Y10_012233 [Tritrichomonas musculus]|uniref:MI domain-containing protein n=1 Tax=Tritrichomonas musculus TaxID=1915356 RepID=A0ABR2IBZ5_9EUKA